MRLSAYNNLGWIRLNLCDWEGATWAYEHALAIDPIHPLPLTSLASVKKWRLNDEVTADELVQRARSVDPDSTLSFLSRAEKVVKSPDCEGSPMKDPQLADALYGLIDHP
jgi:cytochrome c-type biogenesis protein CcmH/NrfG